MKRLGLIIVTTFILSPMAFADDFKHMDCKKIVKACKSAGFKDKDKKFWQGCMKPLVLGRKIEGISVEATEVKACRDKKIAELQQELKEFQSIK
ncbi:hypothetical protein [Legionella gresilensis]|uniref:hypothetical protein n=1 Tax=Legionella gresilensis TaxID=91823 RepID=UPI001040F96F|nr:hypothetical protein [Legionella gresilensis]